MHTVSGGSIGLFAVAMSNDSGGRKTRIRRSKEDRKALAEFFIKKYQKLNSGIFPSLRLTHKEVGGSFYTVREIVREIIQENRVLGSVKFNTEKQNSDELSTHFSVGSVTIDPQIHFPVSSDETCFEHDQQLVTAVEVDLNLHGKVAEHKGKEKDGGKTLNRKHPGEDNGRNDNVIMLQANETSEAEKYEGMEPITLEVERAVEEMEAITFEEEKVVQEIESLTSEAEENVEEMEASAETTDFVPSYDSNRQLTRPEHKGFENLQAINGDQVADENKKQGFSSNESENSGEIKGSFSKVTSITGVIVETFPLRSVTEPSQCLEEEKYSKTGQIVSLNPISVARKVTESGNGSAVLIKTSGGHFSPTADDNISKTLDAKSVSNNGNTALGGLKDSEKDLTVDEITPIDAPNGITPIATKTSTIEEDSVPQKSSREGNPTLDRINLESWTSKKSTGEETNPIVAFFKAFIASFVKFWSE